MKLVPLALGRLLDSGGVGLAVPSGVPGSQRSDPDVAATVDMVADWSWTGGTGHAAIRPRDRQAQVGADHEAPAGHPIDAFQGFRIAGNPDRRIQPVDL